MPPKTGNDAASRNAKVQQGKQATNAARAVASTPASISTLPELAQSEAVLQETIRLRMLIDAEKGDIQHKAFTAQLNAELTVIRGQKTNLTKNAREASNAAIIAQNLPSLVPVGSSWRAKK